MSTEAIHPDLEIYDEPPRFIQYGDPANGGFRYCEATVDSILRCSSQCLAYAEGALTYGNNSLALAWANEARYLQSKLAILN